MAGIVRVKNEDYWIELILRTTCTELAEVIVIDTGSTDHTLSIIQQLQNEGLPIQLFRHQEHPRNFNIVTNLIIERAMHAQYFYLIDGDELQLQPSLAEHKAAIITSDPGIVIRFASHHLFIHPTEFCRCTKPYCQTVRYQAGRVYHRDKLRMSEIHINDGIEDIHGLKPQWRGDETKFIEKGFALHCPYSQRSSNRSWQGHQSLVSSAKSYRKTRYQTDLDHYIKLPFFPKEILTCNYSTHNHYIPQILQTGIPLV